MCGKINEAEPSLVKRRNPEIVEPLEYVQHPHHRVTYT